MSGKNRNKLFLSVLICGILIVIVVFSLLGYIKKLVVQNQYISGNVGKNLPTEFAYTEYVLQTKELDEMIKKGISEEECFQLFGKNSPEISSDDNGIENHSYCYFYKLNTCQEKSQSGSPNSFRIGFNLIFQNSKLTKAIEYRKSIPKDYYDCEAFRSLCIDKNSMDAVVATLGEPAEYEYEADQVTLKYTYRKTSDWLFSPGHAFVYITIKCFQNKILEVDYEIDDLVVEEQKGRLFIKQINQICHCLGEKAIDGICYENPKTSLIPLEQYNIRSIDQLKKKSSKLTIICEKPLLVSFNP